MASFNSVTLVGNVTRDPQVKYLSSGSAVCEFGVAMNSKYKTKDGQQKEEVTFVDVTYFGKVAEVCGQYLHKGSSVLVNGRLKSDSWEDKTTGQKRSKLVVIGEGMQMLGGRGEGGPRHQSESSGPAEDMTGDEHVPF